MYHIENARLFRRHGLFFEFIRKWLRAAIRKFCSRDVRTARESMCVSLPSHRKSPAPWCAWRRPHKPCFGVPRALRPAHRLTRPLRVPSSRHAGKRCPDCLTSLSCLSMTCSRTSATPPRCWLPGRGVQSGRPSISRRSSRGSAPDAEALALWLADAMLTHGLNWAEPVPLIAGQVRRGDLRAPRAIMRAIAPARRLGRSAMPMRQLRPQTFMPSSLLTSRPNCARMTPNEWSRPC
jgi:Protein of unknown function (DUF1403)